MQGGGELIREAGSVIVGFYGNIIIVYVTSYMVERVCMKPNCSRSFMLIGGCEVSLACVWMHLLCFD